MSTDDFVFQRDGSFVRFNQRGVKIAFPDATPDSEYYDWLDAVTQTIGHAVREARILEKSGERESPRRNSGVYYDTDRYDLLHGHMALRTTSNPRTHAFCAFKFGENADGVRRDHRFIFEGIEKLTIQQAPWGPAAVSVVQGLLKRTDITHPGTVMEQACGITGETLSPALTVVQDRRTFYVLLGKDDALRCSLDRAAVTSLRSGIERSGSFSEVEVAIFPRISKRTMADERTWQLIDVLSQSLVRRFPARTVKDSKYRRAAFELGLLSGVR